MAASSSSKVAALANIFQQDQGGKNGVQGGTGDSKSEGSLKILKNSINLKRTSSQVARFSSAKKIFEMKDKTLNKSQSEPPVSGPVSLPDLANTLPHRLCSPRRSGSRIPIGDFWMEKRERQNSDAADKVTEARNKINQIKSSRLNKENVPTPKAQHIQKFDDLADDVKSPVLQKVESQFSGLLESILSPEYKKAEMDFDEIAKENISSDNILDFVEKSTDDVEGSQITSLKEDCHVEGVVEMAKSQDLGSVASKKDVTLEQDCSTNEAASKGKRLQSTPKDSKTKSQERNSCDLSRTRESFNGFETTSEVTLDKTNQTNASSIQESQMSATCESRAANASSLGSSLTGQSVSSWLGTTSATSTINEGGLKTDHQADDTPQAELADNSDKIVIASQEKTESSDYVSGDSCDIISPPPALPVTDSPALNTTRTIQDEVKVHFLEDGHYWYEGSPLAAISREEEFEELLKPKSFKVRFSTSPIRHFSTFSNDDYDRRNEEVDPALATAEYEQEKRMAMMESMTVELNKTSEGGPGISFIGVTMGPSLGDGEDKLSIFVKAVTPGGPSDLEGTIKVKLLSDVCWILLT